MKTNVTLIIITIIVFFMAACSTYRIPYMGVRSSPASVAKLKAAEDLPEEGLKAELDMNWPKAIEVYETELRKNPGNVSLCLRLADIYARLNQLDQVELYLKKAVEADPRNHRILYELSRTYSLKNQPHLGLEVIEKAVEMDPLNKEYLQARAILANWSGDSRTAADSYQRLAKLSPDDKEVLFNLARADAWSGHLDRAVSGYRKYLKKDPENRTVFKDYIKAETWRGNFPRALKLVEQYRVKFGEDMDFLKIKSDVLVRAARPSQGLPLLEKLLAEDPNNYELLYSKAIALHYNQNPRQSLEVVDILKQLRPQSKETDDITRFIRTPLRSYIQLYTGYYFDSDDLSILTCAFKLNLSLSSVTHLNAQGRFDYLRAENGSPLKNIDGSSDATHYTAHLGLRHRFSPTLALDGYVGSSWTEQETTTPIYGIGGDFQLSDTFKVRLSRQYGYFIISPRAVSLGIKRAVNSLSLEWDVSIRKKLVLYGTYETFSDDNSRWEVIVFPRYLSVRTEDLNLDFGFRGWWFGYDLQLGNGYWDPEFFQSYMGALVGYWKINENNGLSFQAACGVLKDNSIDDFVFGYSIDTEAIFGIYKDLALKLRASYLHNIRQYSGAFEAYLLTATLILRL
jgi:tetratricopeptide (TPR) repeat protein